MPPRIKITKEEIINTALDLVRREGEQAINARAIAALLCCSTQPIFSNFATVDALRLAVVRRANQLYREHLRLEEERGEFPRYKASGMAYISFAKQEKELFKLLYMRNRTGEELPEEGEHLTQIEGVVRENTGLDAHGARLFHLEMWAFVHGIATILATDYLDLDRELISRMLTDAYQGLVKRFGKE